MPINCIYQSRNLFQLQRSFRAVAPNKSHKSGSSGGSFFHRRLSSKSPHRNTTANITSEIPIDGAVSSSSGNTLSTPESIGSQGSLPTTSSVPEDSNTDSASANNGNLVGLQKVIRSKSCQSSSSSNPNLVTTELHFGPHSNAAASIQTTKQDLAESNSLHILDQDHQGSLLRRTRNKVVNAFKS